MRTLISVAAMLAAVGMVAGCFTSATAYTETKHTDGSVTVSKVKIIGTGDKASDIAAEGLFADGTQEDLGAGVRTASATQQSTGVKETLEGMGVLLTGIGNLVNRAQDIPIKSSAVSSATANADTLEASSETVAATSGYGGIPGTDGPVRVVVGSEGEGLARLVREHCDVLVSIPIASEIESLNASVAAGVLMFEKRRQDGVAEPKA